LDKGKQRGAFITFEGVDGSGKTTQAKRMHRALEAAGYEAVLTREPGGSPGAEEVRELVVSGARDRWDPVTETLLMSAARRSHVVTRLLPALEGGATVVCDRYVDSTDAFQGAGKGVSYADVVTLNRIATGGLEPDLTFVLDVPPEVGLARAAARGAAPSRFEAMDMEFHVRIWRRYREIASLKRCLYVDASVDEELVWERVRGGLLARLGIDLP
jgi:dTMP kinase